MEELPLYVFEAVKTDNREIIKKYIRSHPDADLDDYGDDGTPLSIAIENGHPRLCKYLIKKGASVDYSISPKRYCPLHTCILSPYPHASLEVMKVLLKLGACPNVRGENDYSPLHFACIMGDRLEHVKLLLKYNADINALTHRGDNALHCALLLHGNLELVKLLVKHNINIMHRNNGVHNHGGETPIEMAKSYGHTHIVHYLQGLIN